jgi:hypothetical protein
MNGYCITKCYLDPSVCYEWETCNDISTDVAPEGTGICDNNPCTEWQECGSMVCESGLCVGCEEGWYGDLSAKCPTNESYEL